ncbi:MAG: hypothetical protein GY757_59380, partial [bacterium]|nr:hypothetical protein [bacterium]
LDNEIIFFTIIAIVGSFPVFPKLTAGYEHLRNNWDSQPGKSSALSIGYALLFNVFLTAVLLLSIMTIVAGTYNPFIYFRF